MSRKELYNQSGRMIDVNSEQGSKDFYTRFFAGFCLIISFDASWMRENVVSASLLVPPSLVQSSNNVFYIYIYRYLRAHTHTLHCTITVCTGADSLTWKLETPCLVIKISSSKQLSLPAPMPS